uniref:Secreted protein n=1 Tax=Macrostomum lignano TaxID=282301 RepID=A0A1I8GX63_9PLAT
QKAQISVWSVIMQVLKKLIILQVLLLLLVSGTHIAAAVRTVKCAKAEEACRTPFFTVQCCKGLVCHGARVFGRAHLEYHCIVDKFGEG